MKIEKLTTSMLTLLLAVLVSCSSHREQSDENHIFSWDNATIYFVYIDRFFNGNPENDINYDRKVDYNSPIKNIATFHGGDIIGLTKKLEENYFKDLGINAIWITGVYEQIHGWVGGGDSNDFPHYAYHGYYPMDFTTMDKNFGTIEEFRNFVDTAHEQGIRIVMDAGINHPGYPTLLDAVQYQFGGVDLTPEEAAQHIEGLELDKSAGKEHYQKYSYLQHFDSEDNPSWVNWWGNEWIRTSKEVDKDVLTESIFGLPDFRTESKKHVDLPSLLVNKWKMEGEEFAPWVNPSALKYRKKLPYSQSDYVIKWLAAWVEEFGIDGFRCDVLDNVDTHRWSQLKNECNRALTIWRTKNKSKSAAKWNDNFWMTGDIWDSGIEYYPNYSKVGFNSIVNFNFPKDGNLEKIGATWQKYANELNSNTNWSTVSFLNNTYKRDTDFSNIKDCGTSLMLAPGAVQIFYGDEVGRPQKITNATDPTHGYRSDFIWNENLELLSHWQKLGQFRKNHLAVGAGNQKIIADNTFLRTYNNENISDTIIIKICKKNIEFVDVSNIFKNGSKLRNAYTGEVSIVDKNAVKFHPENGILLVELIKN